MRYSIASGWRIVCVVLVGALVTSCSTSGSKLAQVDVGPQASASAAIAATAEPAASATARPGTEVPTMATPDMDMYAATPSATPAPRWGELPIPASDAATLARQLAVAEAAIRDPSVSGAQLAYMGHLQQLAYGRLVDYPEWKDSVLAALPDQTRVSVLATLEAGKQLRSISSVVPKSLPDWKIVEAAPIDDLLSYYKEAEDQFGVSWTYLAAIHLVETRMGRIRGLSSAGAQGPMQFMPPTWNQYGRGDINSNHDAILAAARYLKAAGAPGNMPRALFAYNHSNAYVNALMAYADVMRTDPAAYRGYYGWQVYYPTKDGPVLLPVGWTKQ